LPSLDPSFQLASWRFRPLQLPAICRIAGFLVVLVLAGMLLRMSGNLGGPSQSIQPPKFPVESASERPLFYVLWKKKIAFLRFLEYACLNV